MANGRYYEAGTVAGGSDSIDILGDGGFKASQIMIANDHASTACTVQAGAVNAYSVGAGEVLRLVGSFSVITVVDATNAVSYRVYAAEEVAPALNLEKNGGTSALSDLSVTTGKIAAGAVSDSKLSSATGVSGNSVFPKRSFYSTWDFAVDGGAISTITTGCVLPENAVITNAYYLVLDTCTSATDAGTLALGVETVDAAGLFAAEIISTGTTWDATGTPIQCLPDTATIGDWTTGTSDATQQIAFTIAVEAFTAGKIAVFGDYVVYE